MGQLLLKFLVDVGVGRGVEEYLFAAGCDVKAVRDLNTKIPDEEILRVAAIENRMVITMDKDFGELVHNSEKRMPGFSF